MLLTVKMTSTNSYQYGKCIICREKECSLVNMACNSCTTLRLKKNPLFPSLVAKLLYSTLDPSDPKMSDDERFYHSALKPKVPSPIVNDIIDSHIHNSDPDRTITLQSKSIESASSSDRSAPIIAIPSVFRQIYRPLPIYGIVRHQTVPVSATIPAYPILPPIKPTPPPIRRIRSQSRKIVTKRKPYPIKGKYECNICLGRMRSKINSSYDFHVCSKCLFDTGTIRDGAREYLMLFYRDLRKKIDAIDPFVRPITYLHDLKSDFINWLQANRIQIETITPHGLDDQLSVTTPTDDSSFESSSNSSENSNSSRYIPMYQSEYDRIQTNLYRIKKLNHQIAALSNINNGLDSKTHDQINLEKIVINPDFIDNEFVEQAEEIIGANYPNNSSQKIDDRPSSLSSLSNFTSLNFRDIINFSFENVDDEKSTVYVKIEHPNANENQPMETEDPRPDMTFEIEPSIKSEAPEFFRDDKTEPNSYDHDDIPSTSFLSSCRLPVSTVNDDDSIEL